MMSRHNDHEASSPLFSSDLDLGSLELEQNYNDRDIQTRNTTPVFRRDAPIKSLSFKLIITALGLLTLVWYSLTSFSDVISYSIVRMNDKSHVNFMELVSLNYLTMHNGSAIGSTTNMLHGSSFQVHSIHGLSESHCFRLLSPYGVWLKFDKASNAMIGTDNIDKSTKFAAIAADGLYSSPHNIQLKVCNADLWLTFRLDDNQHMIASAESVSSSFLEGLFHATRSNEGERPTWQSKAAVWRFGTRTAFHGVNLGGWFIPEVWMSRSFFNNTGLLWGNSLCTLTKLNRSVAEERMNRLLETWITEKDFEQISEMGFNSIRLPIGYWNVIADPYDAYSPRDHHVSLHYIDWCMEMAARHKLKVLIDLHGTPGSQNGMDHSGCSVPANWLTPSHLALSLDAIRAIAKRYSGHSHLLGIELANEPGRPYSEHNHTVLREYYYDAYHIIRRYSNTTWVVFNELYPEFLDHWDDAFPEPRYHNVVLDLHLYDWQWPYTAETKEEHIRDAVNWESMLSRYGVRLPIIIGEWCMSTGTIVQAGQGFVDAAVHSFRNSNGWFLWNWKLEKGLGFDEWDVQYQYEHGGLDPLTRANDL